MTDFCNIEDEMQMKHNNTEPTEIISESECCGKNGEDLLYVVLSSPALIICDHI